MNKKLLLSVLLLSSTLALSSCALFNDDDIMQPNIYHPEYDEEEEIPSGSVVAGGVVGKEDSELHSLVFKNLSYGTYNQDSDTYTIPNTYKEGGSHHMGYHVNNDQDYPNATSSNNNYDLYVPTTASRTGKHTVILFIHGGAWVSGFKTDVNPYIHEFAKKGYVTATIKYTLLKRTMDDNSLSIFRNLDEIDACIKSIKSVLTSLNFDTTKSELVIGGASSGAHLSMLYAYSRGKESALPIKFLVDAVGPVDIKPNTWKAFTNPSEAVLDAGLDKDALIAQAGNLSELEIAGEGGKRWTDYQTFRIANGMCGLPYTLDEVKAATDSSEDYVTNPNAPAYVNMTASDGGEDQLSVTYWINKADEDSKFPIICAYAGKDSIVGINQYATLQTALEAKGIKSYTAASGKNYIYFKNSEHQDLTPEKDAEHYNELINAVHAWCQADNI